MINKDSYVTKEYLDIKLDKVVDDLSEVIGNFAQNVDQRFNKLEARMDRLEANIDRLTNTLDGFVKRLEDIEIENTARDSKYNRLLEWAKKVSKQTGIPIEY